MSYDLSRLYVSIEHPKGTSFVENSPELSSFKEFNFAGDDVSKVAILSADIDSPFVLIRERKTMIASIFEFLGINDTELMHQITEYRHEPYIHAWTKYIFILNETLYTDWLLAKKQYEFFLIESNKEIDITNRKDIDKMSGLRVEIKRLGEELRDIEAKLFPESKSAREAAILESKKKIKTYAEAYSEAFNFY